jgi:hypothetical protein
MKLRRFVPCGKGGPAIPGAGEDGGGLGRKLDNY